MTLLEAFKAATAVYKERLQALIATEQEVELSYYAHGDNCLTATVYYRLANEDAVSVAKFTFGSLDNCRPIGMCTSVRVWPQFRHRGIGALLQELRITAAYKAGYRVMVCTTLASNEYQNRILIRCGYGLVSEFLNPHTNNRVRFWKKELPNGIERQAEPSVA